MSFFLKNIYVAFVLLSLSMTVVSCTGSSEQISEENELVDLETSTNKKVYAVKLTLTTDWEFASTVTGEASGVLFKLPEGEELDFYPLRITSKMNTKLPELVRQGQEADKHLIKEKTINGIPIFFRKNIPNDEDYPYDYSLFADYGYMVLHVGILVPDSKILSPEIVKLIPDIVNGKEVESES